MEKQDFIVRLAYYQGMTTLTATKYEDWRRDTEEGVSIVKDAVLSIAEGALTIKGEKFIKQSSGHYSSILPQYLSQEHFEELRKDYFFPAIATSRVIRGNLWWKKTMIKIEAGHYAKIKGVPFEFTTSNFQINYNA